MYRESYFFENMFIEISFYTRTNNLRFKNIIRFKIFCRWPYKLIKLSIRKFFVPKKQKKIKDSAFSNIIHWVNGTIVSSNKGLMFQVLFFFIISCKILYKNLFNLFFYNFTRIEIKSFHCSKSKPATHCFIFNLSK